MESDLESLRAEAVAQAAAAPDAAAVAALRARYLGKRSEIAAAWSRLGALPPDRRAVEGSRIHAVRKAIEEALDARARALEEAAERARAESEWLDLTLPGLRAPRGRLHPVTRIEAELEQLFRGMGYRVVEGPWVEDEFHNFEALNMPEWHPARDSWDTFWLSDGNLLRTHTSPLQIRAMRRFGAPLRAVLPGRCFRNEAVDATHECVFSQLEGIVVDRDVTPGHLFHSIRAILSELLGAARETRFRPGYFPFTEPSFECDVRRPDGSWMELCGMGMIHPNVLRAGGVDPATFSGFAFGMGIDRLAMTRFGIDDIRWFHGGDLRFLEQF
jgi:phenylalanyl-tRNA synthetase alpha chain